METFQPGKVDLNAFVDAQSIHPLGRFEINTNKLVIEDRLPDGRENTYFNHGDDADAYTASVENDKGIPTKGIILVSKGLRYAIPDFDFPRALATHKKVTDLVREDMSDEEFMALPNEGLKVEKIDGMLKPVTASFVEESIYEWEHAPSIPDNVTRITPAEDESEEIAIAAD